ncbi:hypothetical protein J40TS1_33780 [Paenibacillus montaniterrae]|uniref:Uncharacterized protein n=1 Tax=Paenibacillus montaniterrae TaxID=429341 RepID=A0A920CYB0_9BACL|nr:hypothetical protein [Paenibacillus montaniterrae]GIP17736.1 hypothetical protein J40TS1_33780 [Paenibacillus montaniterrae]
MRRKFSEEEIEKMVAAFTTVSERVLEIYEKSDGNPDGEPIECPMCEKKKLQYFCDWNGNKHIHAHCDHCNWHVAQ